MMSIQNRRVGLAVVAALVFSVSVIHAAPFWVTTTNDAGLGSLRAAITTANAAGGGEVQFAVSGTIMLATSLPPLINVSIVCPATNTVIISGINTNYSVTNGFRLFTVPTNSSATLQHLTLMNAYGPPPGGGAVLNYGSFTLIQCTLTNNKARFGGAIYSEGGTVTLLRCTLSGNRAVGTYGYLDGMLTVGAESAEGGALCSRNSIIGISDCVFFYNQSLGGDGGVYYFPPYGNFDLGSGSGTGGALSVSGGNLALTNTRFSNNHAYGGSGGGGANGGALSVAGSANIVGCQFLNNGVTSGYGAQVNGGGSGGSGGSASGGAIAAFGPLALFNSSLMGNYATAGDGGSGSRRGTSGSGGIASGGGLWASSTSVVMIACSVAQNQATGGDGAGGYDDNWMYYVTPGRGGDAKGGGVADVSGSSGSVVVVNSTISGNSIAGGSGGYMSRMWPTPERPSYYASGGVTSGGGLWASGSVCLTNATVAFNSASGTNGVGGGVYGGRLRNCILTGNSANSSPDAANVTSLGFNLFSQSGLANLMPTDQQNVNGGLGPLQDNGGPTMTHALLAGSPAINQGNSGGITADQRGYPRPIVYPGVAVASNGDDIGAYELNPAPRSFRMEATSVNFAITFLTVSEGQYRIEYTDTLVNPNWRTAATSIQGNGGGVRVSLSTVGVANRFYRIVREN